MMPDPTTAAGITAALVFGALLVAHHLGDHWFQSEFSAIHKGDHDRRGQLACAWHVTTYTATTTAVVLAVLILPLGATATWHGVVAGQMFSAATHYAIDRRWTLAWLADRVGKRAFHDLGQPRTGYTVMASHTVPVPGRSGDVKAKGETVMVPLDQPTMGTGAYSLDQALHITALFVAALLTALS